MKLILQHHALHSAAKLSAASTSPSRHANRMVTTRATWSWGEELKNLVISAVEAKVADRKAIDVHHHIVPDFYAKAVKDAGGDPSGHVGYFGTPDWSEASFLETCEKHHIAKAMVSVTSPGPKIVMGEKSKALARELNNFSRNLQAKYPSKVGIFGSLPDFVSSGPDSVLEEIENCKENGKLWVDGFTVFTSYGDHHAPKYLGHDSYDSVWELSCSSTPLTPPPTCSARSALSLWWTTLMRRRGLRSRS